MHIALPVLARDAATRSKLEEMAADAAVVSRPRQGMLGILLNATLPMTNRGRPALRPLWANEAMNRAYKVIRLTAALERCAPLCRFDLIVDARERGIATEIATVFRALDDDDEVVPCSESLGIAVRGLVELFGPIAGSVCLQANIEQLELPGFRRRALVLAACDLVSGVLLGGLIKPGSGPIKVVLRKTGLTEMRLMVSGAAFGTIRDRPSDTLSDLAALLKCGPSYSMPHKTGAAAELTFPIDRLEYSTGARSDD